MAADVLTVGSLFSGIGGIDLGLERTGGFRTSWFAEVDPFCAAVLKRHWPDVPNLGDVRAITGAQRVDVLAGGFPCQPVSLAGKRQGQDDARWLWPEFARLIGELRPRIVLVENVPGLASKGLGDVLADLSTLGYDAEWDVVSAAALGASHLRERLFLVAYPDGPELRLQPRRGGGADGQGAPLAGFDGEARALADAGSLGRLGRSGIEGTGREAAERGEAVDHAGHGRGSCGGAPLADPDGPVGPPPRPAGQAVFRPEAVERLGRRGCGLGRAWPTEPSVGRVAHGVPARLDRLRALGNGVVPQCAEFVGHLISEAVQEGRL